MNVPAPSAPQPALAASTLQKQPPLAPFGTVRFQVPVPGSRRTEPAELTLLASTGNGYLFDTVGDAVSYGQFLSSGSEGAIAIITDGTSFSPLPVFTTMKDANGAASGVQTLHAASTSLPLRVLGAFQSVDGARTALALIDDGAVWTLKDGKLPELAPVVLG